MKYRSVKSSIFTAKEANFVRIFLLSYLLVVSSLGWGQSSLFSAVLSERSGITFSNNIKENKDVNIMKYDYLYNGAGVGVGDFNKDGLPDLFFAGNMVNDKLYFNQGKMSFEDVSKKANIAKQGWSTGVCVFDVNADGWDDIYVLRSGPEQYNDKLGNVLYVNQKDGTFKEEAAEYGLELNGHHVQAAPLDIDLDGDLDLYVMGHPGTFQHKANFQEVIKAIQSGEVESDVLLENVGGKFIDITKESGILEYGYGLGLAISDVNDDGYPDILVCNDFDEPDHLFVNQQNSTFRDESLLYFKHTSNYSMGNDVGDINNDGLMDYISVDMAFENHERSKTNMASMSPEKFAARVKLGWGHQYMHNMLHLNTGMGSFQEVAQFAGVAKTDWSWAPLFLDMDMDGQKDLFITNGYKRDTKNNDIGTLLEAAKDDKGELTIEEFLALIPAVKIENFFFENIDGLRFEDRRSDWGVDEKLNSNGAAYADLDLDGDWDLILNNMDTTASIYENQLKSDANALIIDLSGYPQAEILGAKIEVNSNYGKQVQEVNFVRGYCSTVEKKIVFYNQESMPFHSLKVTLTNGNSHILHMPKSNSTIELTNGFEGFERYEPAEDLNFKNHFTDITKSVRLDVIYQENKFNDFETESLLPHRLSTAGPEIEVADFDKNGLDDFIITSAIGKIPMVYLQNSNGTFKKKLSRSFYNHHSTEDIDIKAFHVNGDENIDIMVSSGGYQYAEKDTNLENRLYIGNGLGMFGLVENAMPKEMTNSGKLIPEDIDGDGDLDFLVCGKGYPGKYPYSGKTKIYVNDKGFFSEQTQLIAPQIEYVGIVNDACFSDIDGDGDRDILLVGEWMDVVVFENVSRKFIKSSKKTGIPGWWTTIVPVDIDGDGDEDYVLGNAGMNNKFRATKSKPLDIYANDFDSNGSLDIVLAYTKGDYQIPVRGKECSTGQMPFLADKFPTFSAFANSELEEIYGKEKLRLALHYQATEFRNGILYNDGKGTLSFNAFPDPAQLSFINAYQVLDFNGDGLLDVVGVGNRYNTEVETSRSDAGVGVVLVQTQDGSWVSKTPKETGFYAPYNAKSLELIKLGKEGTIGLLVGNNNQRVQLFRLEQ